MYLDLINLQKMIDEKFISVQKHPNDDLFIYNYTQKAQFAKEWNNETLQCRGLIMDGNKNIIARPFPKFFNYSEVIEQGGQIPAEDFIVTEKMDGSLGILYWNGASPYIATRGSFNSDQAIKGSAILQTLYADHGPLAFNDRYTYLFEIIYPDNRIVVNYGDMTALVLLAIIETATGIERPYEELLTYSEYFPVVKKHDAIKDFTKIEQVPNSEGYVITFPTSRQRFKIKFEEYVRLHRLVTGVNARSIWDLLRNKQPFNELLERVPDEFYNWVKETKKNLEYEYEVIEVIAQTLFGQVKKMKTRKEQAVWLMSDEEHRKYSSIVFSMLDKKPYDEIIWKMLKPTAEKPFTQEI